MVLEKLRKKFSSKVEAKKKVEDEFIEIDESLVSQPTKISIRVESLNDYSDTDRIQQLLREGNIIFLRIKELRKRDLSELKRAVEKIKRTCVAVNGDIVGVNEDFIILTPSFARIYKGK